MSDAIRCGECRWWRQHDEGEGTCELNPPLYTGGSPIETMSFFQPITCEDEGCSHGERRPQTEGEE